MNTLFGALSDRLETLLTGHSPLLLPGHAGLAGEFTTFATSFGDGRLYGVPFVFASGTRAYTAGFPSHNQGALDSAAASAPLISQDDERKIATVGPTTLNLDWSLVAHTRLIAGVHYAIRQGQRLQQRYSLGVAEIICEGVGQVNLAGADKYDCFRIHNLNRGFAVQIAFDGHRVTVPPWSCRTVRRTGLPGAYTYRDGTYFWPVLTGDPRLLRAGIGIEPRVQGADFLTCNPERSMAANNVANPMVALAWLSALESTDLSQSTGWAIDRSKLTDLGSAHRALFADPGDPHTLLGDLIHHKGDLACIKTVSGSTSYVTIPFRGHADLWTFHEHATESYTPDGALKLEPAPSGASVALIGLTTNVIGGAHAAALPHTCSLRPAATLAIGRYGGLGAYTPDALTTIGRQRSETYYALSGKLKTVTADETFYVSGDERILAMSCRDTVGDLALEVSDLAPKLDGSLVYDGAQWCGTYALPTMFPISNLPSQFMPMVGSDGLSCGMVWVIPWFSSRSDDGSLTTGLSGLWLQGGWWQSPREDRVFGTFTDDGSSPDWAAMDVPSEEADSPHFFGIRGKVGTPVRVLCGAPAEPMVRNSPTPQAFSLLVPPPDNLDAAAENWQTPGWWTQHGKAVLDGTPIINDRRFLRVGLFVEHYNHIADLINSITRMRPLLYTDLRFIAGAQVLQWTPNSIGLIGTSGRPANQFASLTLGDANDQLAQLLQVRVRTVGDLPADVVTAAARIGDGTATDNIYRVSLQARCLARDAVYYPDVGQWMGRATWEMLPDAAMTFVRVADYSPLGGHLPVSNVGFSISPTQFRWIAADDLRDAATRDGWPFIHTIVGRPSFVDSVSIDAGNQHPKARVGVNTPYGPTSMAWTESSGILRATEAEAISDMDAPGTVLEHGHHIALPRVYVTAGPAVMVSDTHLVRDLTADDLVFDLPRCRSQQDLRRDVAVEIANGQFPTRYHTQQVTIGLVFSEPENRARTVAGEIETVWLSACATDHFRLRTGVAVSPVVDFIPEANWTSGGRDRFNHRMGHPTAYRPVEVSRQDPFDATYKDLPRPDAPVAVDHRFVIGAEPAAAAAIRVVTDHCIQIEP